ncbi:hypothetical protein ACMWQU_27460, partial [Escherichia coli]|uniref:hypothetical protein n=1 Tax=Escherichia coli TaxID=562 RepID=UPI0039DFCF4D
RKFVFCIAYSFGHPAISNRNTPSTLSARPPGFAAAKKRRFLLILSSRVLTMEAGRNRLP